MTNIAIVGGSGYTGAELIKLLARHPEVRLTHITAAAHAGKKVSSLYPGLIDICDIEYQFYQADQVRKEADICFLALPHGKSMEAAAELVEGNVRVIDLSGDFRLSSAEIYEQWYMMRHTARNLLNKAVYGLPELFGQDVDNSFLVANPGCFPTAALLSIAPLLSEDLIDFTGITITALTGVSGAGHRPRPENLFGAIAENALAYKAGGEHQHIPEMERYMSRIAGDDIKVSFTPYLVPMNRGILSTAKAQLTKAVNMRDAVDLYRDFYKGKMFVKVLDPGQLPETKNVRGSNYCHIGIKVDDRTGSIVTIAAIDNLVKGASGQAVQNMNLMLDLPEETGLDSIALTP